MQTHILHFRSKITESFFRLLPHSEWYKSNVWWRDLNDVYENSANCKATLWQQTCWGNLKNKQHTIYDPTSLFITHRYIDFSYFQIYTQFQWSFISSPTLVKLQGDDQLNRADYNASVCSVEYGCSFGTVSPQLQIHHLGLLPHVPGEAIPLQEDDVFGSDFSWTFICLKGFMEVS